MAVNEKLVELFYNMYFRPPKRHEFLKCGGNLYTCEKEHGNYTNFIASLGYEYPHSRKETYNVVNTRGTVIFTGTIAAIAEEFNTTKMNVIHAANYDGMYRREYKVVLKPFNNNAAKKIKKEAGIKTQTQQRDMFVENLKNYLLEQFDIKEDTAKVIAKMLYKIKDDKCFKQLLKGE